MESDNSDEDLVFANIYDGMQTNNIVTSFFNTQEESPTDKLFLEREDLDEDEYPQYNKQLPAFNNKKQSQISWDKIQLITGIQQDQGILDSNLTDRKLALDLQLKIFEQLLDPIYKDTAIVGRIIYPGENFNNKLPMYFQNSSITQELDLTKLEQYFLYPGQIVAFEFDDINSQILEPIRMIPFNQSPSALEEELPDIIYKEQNALSIVVVSGPFSHEDSIRYLLLDQLIDNINKKEFSCDILILLGPILSENNSKIQDLDTQYMTFYDQVIEYLESQLPNIKIIVVNSTKDLTNLNPIPQPPHQTNKTSKNLKHVGNPTIIEIDQVCQIAMIDADIFLQLKKNSLSQGIDKKEPFKAIFRQFSEQRSFFPLYPSSELIDQTKINEELSMVWNNQQGNLRLKQLKGYNEIQEDYINQNVQMHRDFIMPNIFIAPSGYGPFIHFYDDKLFINPGSLVQKNTFAHLVLHMNNGKSGVETVRAQILRL